MGRDLRYKLLQVNYLTIFSELEKRQHWQKHQRQVGSVWIFKNKEIHLLCLSIEINRK